MGVSGVLSGEKMLDTINSKRLTMKSGVLDFFTPSEPN